MKRILVLLTVAAIFAAVMAISAVSVGAAPDCGKVGDNNKNCVTTTTTTGPGGSETAPGAASTKNPNVRTTTTTTFAPGTPGG